MARPKKEGMDYFPHDTDAVNDEKIEALRMLYGNDGYAFYFILLERIYRAKEFELDVSDAETIQILSRKVSVTEEKFGKMLETSLKRGCFDRQAYEERKVLTSEGIKKRASVVVEKRVKMRSKYQEEKENVSDAETNQETDSETPQSKEKESKEKESKEKESKEVIDYRQQMRDLLLRYSNVEGFTDLNNTYWNVVKQTRKTGIIQPKVMCDNVKKWEEFNPIVVKFALTKHLENNYNDKSKDEKYTLGIMRRTTSEEAEDRLNRKEVTVSKHSNSKVVDFTKFAEG